MRWGTDLTYQWAMVPVIQCDWSSHMQTHFHTVVIGGGCLGSAAAVSIQRRLRRAGMLNQQVVLLEKQ